MARMLHALLFFRTFFMHGVFDENSSLISLTDETARRVIDTAYALLLCMELDDSLLPYLADARYDEVKIGKG
ncbi:MAG: hypothetical protein IJL87_06200 [Clostridia bacterium]|nr:hypothetical protein [Clostridia bacterium]